MKQKLESIIYDNVSVANGRDELLVELRRLEAHNAELLEALKQLYSSFTITGAIKGNKGNKAKHDVIMHNEDVRKALNVAIAAIEKARS